MSNLELCKDFSCIYFDPIFSALLAGLIVYIIDVIRTKRKSKKRFGKIAGNYEGFGYVKGDKLTLNPIPQTEATVKYLKNNLLEISVKEKPNKEAFHWRGIISLELENYGTITWNYVVFEKQKLGENKHKFGMKKIIINESDKYIYLYLAESDIENKDGIDRQIFKRKKIAN
jgi:hypothetical protein